MRLLILTATFSIFLCGCPARFYAGPARPNNEIARIYVARGAFVRRIDGSLSLVARPSYEVLPGKHRIEVAYTTGLTNGTANCFVDFEAEAGREYWLIAYHPRSFQWGALLRKLEKKYPSDEIDKPYSKDSDVVCDFRKK